MIENSTTSCVHVNNYFTNVFLVTSGVKHGDTLSLALFCIYIND